jgi:DNA-binding HxlR family transcriptional regulator
MTTSKQQIADGATDGLLRLLTGPWTPTILDLLRTHGPLRFGDLKRRVTGISAKVLTERLRALESAGIIDRRAIPSVPPRVLYAIAARGEQIKPLLDQINQLAVRWRDEDSHNAQPASRDEKRLSAA